MSLVESILSELDSIRIGSAQNLTRVQNEHFFQLEFGSFKVHEQLGFARYVHFICTNCIFQNFFFWQKSFFCQKYILLTSKKSKI